MDNKIMELRKVKFRKFGGGAISGPWVEGVFHQWVVAHRIDGSSDVEAVVEEYDGKVSVVAHNLIKFEKDVHKL